MSKVEMVKKYIMDEIEQRKMMEGQRLLGCREIAKTLCVNKITVNKAYKALEEEHFIYCIPRGGYYVIKSCHENKPSSKTIDFQTVVPDCSLVPYQSFTHAINLSIEESKKKLFLYDSPIGFTELRESLGERFAQTGVYAPSSQIIVTNGAQQGINLALKSIFGFERDRKLLVESPTYHAIHDMARALNIDCVTIRRDSVGIDLNELEYIFQTEKVKAFYIIPRFHNPTGYTLSEKNKSKIADLCGRYRILMIEDDYLADLGTDKRCLPLHYYDTNQLTIYIRSFSKTFLPGIRLGAMVVPDTLSSPVIQQKYLSDICTSGIVQGALNFFLTSGMYDRHIRKVNACYRQKLVKAKAILSQADVPGLSFHVPKQGLFLWILLPNVISAELIAEKLVHENILVTQYYISKDGQQGIRLCIAGVTKEDLDALETVIKVIREEIGTK